MVMLLEVFQKQTPRTPQSVVGVLRTSAFDSTTTRGWQDEQGGARETRESTAGESGRPASFFELNPQESAYVELKVALSRSLQERRRRKKLTQEQLARLDQIESVARCQDGGRGIRPFPLICWFDPCLRSVRNPRRSSAPSACNLHGMAP